MAAVLKVAAAMLTAMGLLALVIFWGDDSTTLVPPPDAVAESFMRQIATRRYDRALQYVGQHSGISLESVRQRGQALHAQAGPVDTVETKILWMDGETATVEGQLETGSLGVLRYTFRLRREHHLWKVMEWRQ